MQKRVLVIGGGVAGIAGALEVAAKGYEACLVEKESEIGGRAINYCCKATDKCNKCSACLVPQAKVELEKNSAVTVYKNSEVTAIKGQAGDFKVKVKTPHGDIDLEVGAIIVATGFAPFDITNNRKEYGYGINPKVVTGLDFEKALKEKGSVSVAYGPVRNIGFIQCVGSRDLSYDCSGYCSKVCCMYATKLAKLVRSELPEAELSIFYMDLQTFGRGFDEFVSEAKYDDNIQFVRGIPAKIYSFSYDRLTVKYADSLTGEAVEDMFDVIVLSTAITPGADTIELATMLNIATDAYGFFKADETEPIISDQAGIFLAGTCQSPKDIPQSMVQGKAAASAAIELMVK